MLVVFHKIILNELKEKDTFWYSWKTATMFQCWDEIIIEKSKKIIYFAIEIFYIVNTKLNIINSISGKLLIVEKEQYI
jgi:hypothetical protein